MDIFDLSPEELASLALIISIGLAKEYNDDGQLEILAAIFNSIGDTLDLLVLQRAALAVKTEKNENDEKLTKKSDT